MSDHQHATDRVDGMALATCPNDCDVEIELEYQDAADNEILEDLKEIMRTCQVCGEEMEFIIHEEPTEVLD